MTPFGQTTIKLLVACRNHSDIFVMSVNLHFGDSCIKHCGWFYVCLLLAGWLPSGFWLPPLPTASRPKKNFTNVFVIRLFFMVKLALTSNTELEQKTWTNKENKAFFPPHVIKIIPFLNKWKAIQITTTINTHLGNSVLKDLNLFFHLQKFKNSAFIQNTASNVKTDSIL